MDKEIEKRIKPDCKMLEKVEINAGDLEYEINFSLFQNIKNGEYYLRVYGSQAFSKKVYDGVAILPLKPELAEKFINDYKNYVENDEIYDDDFNLDYWIDFVQKSIS